MIKYIQFIFLFIFSFFFLTISAQNDRVKVVRVEQPAAPQKTTAVNTTEKKDYSANKIEKKESIKQLKLVDPSLAKSKKTKPDETISTLSAERVLVSDNVTYEKEALPVNEKVVSLEKKLIKVIPSENYKPRMVKEDIRPVIDYSKVEVTSNKRIYLQQEADDLQREINQNSNNSNYDIAKKQKQLEDIKKLLQN